MGQDQAQTIKIRILDQIRYQQSALAVVSRSFALTIPMLPTELQLSIGNAYLLCRIADTVEDDPAINAEQTKQLQDQFVEVLYKRADPDSFAGQVVPLLGSATPESEKQLVAETRDVVAITHSLPARTQDSLIRCVQKMCFGMPDYQNIGKQGLKDQADMDRYCYFVAGVVGEMLTEVFCDYAEDIAEQREKLEALSTSFGQGLQMTNILKDIWDDWERGFCWLPVSLFEQEGYSLQQMSPQYQRDRFNAIQAKLIGLAHGHLSNALDYSLLIPARHTGIRIFCLWAIGLAVPTLKKITQVEDYGSGQQVKIAKPLAVFVTTYIRYTVRSDWAQRCLINLLGRSLPFVAVDPKQHSQFIADITPQHLLS